MPQLSAPFLTFGIAALLGGAVICLRAGSPRRTAVIAATAAFGCFLLATRETLAAGTERLFDPWLEWLEADALDAVPMTFFGALTLGILILAPRRDASAHGLAGILLLAAATQIAYGAANLVVLAAGWWLTSLPFGLGLFGRDASQKVTLGFLLASSAALTGAIVLLHHVEMTELSDVNRLAFGLLLLAVALRKGVFPLHGWMLHAFEHGPLLPTALLFNGHLGALLIARSEAAALPQAAKHALDLISIAALATALFTSLRAFAESKPRRLLGLLCLSQASFILAGIATDNAEGVTGALVHWMVVAAASTGLIAIVRVLEVRVSGTAEPAYHWGMAVKAPRLATFFFICGLALIGLPGTLGYCAEDLLFHGALENHPWLGLALPVATAFNAINLMRLHGIIFLGMLPKRVIDIPDALPRERWPLAICVVFLIAGGLFPKTVIRWRSIAAERIQFSMSSIGEPATAPIVPTSGR